MKKFFIQTILLGLLCLFPQLAGAYDFEQDGIYYEISTSSPSEVTVVHSEYTGSIIIPETVTNQGSTYTVTKIAGKAFSECTKLTSVTIPNTVTTIGWCAFGASPSLTSVIIPNSVTSIGSAAFTNCSALTSVTLPEGLTKIGNSFFYNCTSLTSVKIPSNVTSIDAHAFRDCQNLTSIEIPANVTEISNYAFDGCSALTSIELGNKVTYIGASAFEDCSKLSIALIPYNITMIANSTFRNCSNLSYITLYDRITSIGASAFEGCSALTSIEIPDSVTSIGASAFAGCSGLTSIEIPGSVTSIDASAFAGCSAIKELIIADNNTTLSLNGDSFNGTAIESLYLGRNIDDSFYNLSKLKEVTIGKNVTIIGTSTFNNCSALTTVKISNGTKWSETLNFYSIPTLTEFIVDENNNDFSTNEGVLLNNTGTTLLSVPCTKSGSYKIPDGVTTINESAFCNCSQLTSLEIPESVATIGESAFLNCSGLTSIKILGNRITTIEESAFKGCSGLTSIEIPRSITTIGKSAFLNCSGLTSIKILGNIMTTIGESAFEGCSGLTSIEIPRSITTIGKSAFLNCSGLTSIKILGNIMTTIGESAFEGCSGLTSIEIPGSVATIGEFAFKGCSNLKKLTLAPGNTTLSLIKDVFYETSIESLSLGRNINGISNNLSKLKELIIANNVPTTIYEFRYCPDLTSVIISSNVTSVKNLDFYSIPSLTEFIVDENNNDFSTNEGVLLNNSGTTLLSAPCAKNGSYKIPDGVTTINESAFRNCSQLTSLEIPESVATIGKSAFEGCSGLTSIEIPGNVTKINNDAFAGCSALTSIEIPGNVTSIGSSAFAGCSGLTSIEIPGNVTSIGSSAFAGCSGLTSIEIPGNVTSIGSSAFAGCSGLKELVIADGDEMLYMYSSFDGTTIESLYLGRNIYGSFKNWDTLKKVSIGNEVTAIGESAFKDCSGLTSIEIPESVTSIGAAAFEGCSALKEVILAVSSTTLSLEDNTFSGTAIESLYLGRNISGSFKNWIELKELTIGSRLTTIDKSTFEGCIGLTTVRIANNVRWIETLNFYYIPSFSEFIVDKGNYYISSIDGVLFDITGTTLLAFPRCKSGSYKIPDGVTKIKESAFRNCNGLTSLEIPSSVTSIGVWAFKDCSTLKDLIISDSNTALTGEDSNFNESSLETIYLGRDINISFSGQSNLEELTIGSKVTAINESAFAGCTGLTSLIIPDNVTSINSKAFIGCTKISNITLGKGLKQIGYSAFSTCTAVTTIDIPDSVSILGDYAFAFCNGLHTITLGCGLKEIGRSAFENCTDLKTILCRATTPPTCKALCFNNVDKAQCYLLIPFGAGNAYKTANEWKDFFLISGIKENVLDNKDKIVMYKLNGKIRIDNVAPETPIAIFSSDGKLVYNGKTTQEPLEINLPEGHLYIVKCADKAEKIIL